MRVLLFLLAALLPQGAVAQTSDPPLVLPNGVICPMALPAETAPLDGWSQAERWAWLQICAGRPADMRWVTGNSDGGACAPWMIEGSIPENRRLGPEFLYLVLARKEWSGLIPTAQVAIRCAYFEGTIALTNADIGPEVFIEASRLGDVLLGGARFHHSIWIEGSRIDGQIHAGLAQFGGVLHLLHTTLSKATFTRARVHGDVSLRGSSVTEELSADGIEIGGSVYLRGGGTYHEIDFKTARIGGRVHLSGSTFTGPMDFSGTTMGELIMYRPGTVEQFDAPSDDPIWTDEASLVLRNTTASALQSRLASWNKDSGALPVDLGGFEYQRLEGLRAEKQETLVDLTSGGLREWLQSVSGDPSSYEPQPFEQLAKVLDEAGMTDKAKYIRYAKFEHRDATQPGTWWQTYLIRPAAKWIIGYGVYPFTALAWFFGMVGLGALVAIKSKDSYLAKPYRKAWYSLETALPLVEFSEAHKTIDHQNGWVESYFHAQKVLGFVLATVLVGALTLLPG